MARPQSGRLGTRGSVGSGCTAPWAIRWARSVLPRLMAAAHPTDQTTFPPAVIPRLRVAVDELSWLLGRGYAEDSALTLVGNRHQLDVRQRMAVRRCACSEAVAHARRARRSEQAIAVA